MTKKLAPHLVEDRGVQVCSVCAQSFATTSGPSMSLAFRKHVEAVHSEQKQREAAAHVKTGE